MKYYPMKPGDTTQIILLNPDQVITLCIEEQPVEEKIFNSIAAKNLSCPYCEEERINSRFEILDL